MENTTGKVIGVAPYDKNHTENIDSRKIGITRCFFVLYMSGYITNCMIEFYSILLFCRVENGDRFQQRQLQNRIVDLVSIFSTPRRNYIGDIACEYRNSPSLLEDASPLIMPPPTPHAPNRLAFDLC